MITVTRFVTGPIETNTYVVADENKNCLVIDPSSGCGDAVSKIKTDGLKTQAIVLTHGHFDHIMGLGEIIDAVGDVPVYIHRDDRSCLSNAVVNMSTMVGEEYVFDGKADELIEGKMRIGSFDLEVFHIPGHTPGGCVLVIENSCICGDVLFAGSVGRSDLPDGNGAALVAGIKKKLFPLPDDTVVYPGHGTRTTIAREKRSNPYLQ
jgi:hydroxyacylglutathione hydrolase